MGTKDDRAERAMLAAKNRPRSLCQATPKGQHDLLEENVLIAVPDRRCLLFGFAWSRETYRPLTREKFHSRSVPYRRLHVNSL